MNIYIKNLGCNRRGLDALRVANYFKSNNCSIIENKERADLILLFTCGYIRFKENESLNYIQYYSKKDGKLIVLGCLPAIAKDKIRNIFNGVIMSSKNLEKIDNFFQDFQYKYKNTPDVNFIFNSTIKKSEKAIIRISNGCQGNCSYCAIKFATGNVKSKPIEIVIQEYKNLLIQGYRSFIINSEDCGYYGLDINTSLTDLLLKMSDYDEKYYVDWFIQTINPKSLISNKKSLIELTKSGKIKKIKSDIQSGSASILKSMCRYSNIEKIIKVFDDLKEKNRDLYMISQIIIGFPSESEEDFNKTLNVMDILNLEQYEIFLYSDREGTEAEKMDNKISPKKKDLRLNKMIKKFESSYNVIREPYKVYLRKI